MAEKPGLPKCSVAGCEQPVSKLGHTLCHQHWLSAKRSEKTSVAVPRSEGNAKAGGYLSSTALGERLGLSSQRVNQVLAELGWVQKDRKGWVPTHQGQKLKAESREHHQSGVPFVVWPEAILASRVLLKTVHELTGNQSHETPSAESTQQNVQVATEMTGSGFREKFPPSHRATDGHWVRSKAEALIDNWLYMAGLVHAYERQLPVEEELYCDFYIPGGKVYIEYWGLENDPKYAARKKTKLDIYRKYGFNLIELTEEHVCNLDDHLPKMLLKYNVIVS